MDRAVQHDWVERSAEFEAVLVCMNELPAYDSDAVLRAFQTYQFDDATTPGNDQSFVHVETGMIVRYDGGILAIEYGHGALDDAFADLFFVLRDLGWQKSELHHPDATINQLLGDMGKAIPANWPNFDIVKPKAQPVSEFAESAALITRGRELLAKSGGVDAVSSTLMAGIESFGVSSLADPAAMTLERDVHAAPAPGAPPARFVIELEEEEGESQGGNAAVGDIVVFQPRPAVGKAVHAFADDLDALPIFALPEDRLDVAIETAPVGLEPAPAEPGVTAGHDDSAAVDADIEVSEAFLDRSLVVACPSVAAPLMVPIAVPVGAPRVATVASVPAVARKAVDEREVMSVLPASDVECVPLSKVIEVGLGAICFDLPGVPMTDDDVQSVADELGVGSVDVVHVFPGAVDSTIRWNALGEVVAQYPWFAEKVAGAMLMDGGNCVLAGAMILALQSLRADVQLRDLLEYSNWPEAEMASTLIGELPSAEVLISRAAACGDLALVMDAIDRRLGGLSLARTGSAFVDLPVVDGEIDETACRVFTVREMAQSQAAQIMIVHVDFMDGPFVLWLAEFLRFVASNYSATARYACEIDAGVKQRAAAEQATKAAAISDATAMAVAAMERLQELGVTI